MAVLFDYFWLGYHHLRRANNQISGHILFIMLYEIYFGFIKLCEIYFSRQMSVFSVQLTQVCIIGGVI